jgi:hypothetical protein
MNRTRLSVFRSVGIGGVVLGTACGVALADPLPGVGRFDCRITSGELAGAEGEAAAGPRFLQLMVMGAVVRAFGAEGVDGAYEVTERIDGERLAARRTVDASGSGRDAEMRLDLAARALEVKFTDSEGEQRSLGGDCAVARDY